MVTKMTRAFERLEEVNRHIHSSFKLFLHYTSWILAHDLAATVFPPLSLVVLTQHTMSWKGTAHSFFWSVFKSLSEMSEFKIISKECKYLLMTTFFSDTESNCSQNFWEGCSPYGQEAPALARVLWTSRINKMQEISNCTKFLQNATNFLENARWYTQMELRINQYNRNIKLIQNIVIHTQEIFTTMFRLGVQPIYP